MNKILESFDNMEGCIINLGDESDIYRDYAYIKGRSTLDIKISEYLSIKMYQSLKALMESLDSRELKYKIIYDSENKKGKHEQILNINLYNIEVQAEDDYIIYVKGYNTNIMEVEDSVESPVKLIEGINKVISQMAICDAYSLDIISLDITSMQCIFVANCDKNKFRVMLSRDMHGSVYIQSIRAV